jgi:hypothetical protein
VAQLGATTEDKHLAREPLFRLLAQETDGRQAQRLLARITGLNPTAQDLSAWQTWVAPPTAGLITAVRRNSALEDWLAVLPSLSSLCS